MQQSIKKFVQKSPELARSMGLLQQSTHQPLETLNMMPNMSASVTVSGGTTANSQVDSFSSIKADEKNISGKRKQAVSIGDIPPEQICKYTYLNDFSFSINIFISLFI